MEGWKKPPRNLRILRVTSDSWGGDLECEAAVHCIGVLFGRSPAEYHSANVQGAMTLLKALPSSAKIVLLSSQSAGGPTSSEGKARDEETPDTPITGYGKSKKEMELACLSAFSDRDILILRPPMVLGARDQATLPLFRLAAGWVRPKPGLRSKRYSFLAVNDLCAAIFAVLDRDTTALRRRIFYVCHPESFTDRELIECAGRLLGKKGWVLPLPQICVRTAALLIDALPSLRHMVPSLTRDRVREIFPDYWVISGRRFKETFDFHCKTRLADALSDTWKWYQLIATSRNQVGKGDGEMDL